MSEVKITTANFEQEVVNSDVPVLVDFWAAWCGPCQMIGPSVAELAEEYAGKVKVGKVNVDEEPELAIKFQVASIPNVKLFKGGQVVNEIVGAVPKGVLKQMIDE